MNQLQEIEQGFGIQQAQVKHTSLQGADEYRGMAEIQAQLVIAQKFPRNEQACIERIKNAFGRVSLAQQAEFEIPKGGNILRGETIRAMEAIAQLWGNITWEWREVFRDNGYSDVAAYAWDMQSNVRRMVTFRVRHWIDMKQGGRPPRDEREIYELLANMAQRRVRACLKAVIPGDVTEYALMQSRETLASKFVINDETRKKMLESYEQFGVSKAQIEKRIGRKFESIDQGQWGQLRRIYQAIKDGMTTTDEAFEPAEISDIRKKATTKSQESKKDEPQQEPIEVSQPESTPALSTGIDAETGEQWFHSIKTGEDWNAEIHSSPPSLNADGSFSRKRGRRPQPQQEQPPQQSEAEEITL